MFRNILTSCILMIVLGLMCLTPVSEAGPIACIALLGACAGPCILTGPGFVACASISCGISQTAIAAACFSPIP